MSAEVQGQGHKTQTWTRCHRQTEIPGETHRRPRSGRAEQGCSGGKEGHGRGGGRAAAACLDPGVHSEGLERLPGGAQGPGGSLAHELAGAEGRMCWGYPMDPHPTAQNQIRRRADSLILSSRQALSVFTSSPPNG